jgi:hypothetical protein
MLGLDSSKVVPSLMGGKSNLPETFLARFSEWETKNLLFGCDK